MTKLAISDSPLSRQLLLAGELEVDYLETSAHLAETAITAHPDVALLLHNALWDWSLAHPEALEHKDALVLSQQRLALTKAPFLSIHLGFSAAQVMFDRGMQTLSPTLARDALLNVMVTNIKRLKRVLSVPLLLENLDYVPGAAYDHICQPDFIAEVLQATDTYLLLDLAHAQVSASVLGYPLEAYLSQLPLARIRQLHVSGPRERDGQLHDAHAELQAYDYALLKDVLVNSEVWALTLEYKRNKAELLHQVATLRKLLEP